MNQIPERIMHESDVTQDVLIIDTEEGLECEHDHPVRNSSYYEQNLNRLKRTFHSQCLFNRQQSFIPDLHFHFDDSGALHGQFSCGEQFQGYDGMVHGGIVAAIIDASMAQCLMGHGIAGVTIELTVKYRKPVLTDKKTDVTTRIESVNCGILHTLKCEIVQNHNLVVQGTGRFCIKK